MESWELVVGADRFDEGRDLTKAEANPATRMDSVITKSGGSGSHVELPRVAGPIQGKSREVHAAGKRPAERLTKIKNKTVGTGKKVA